MAKQVVSVSKGPNPLQKGAWRKAAQAELGDTATKEELAKLVVDKAGKDGVEYSYDAALKFISNVKAKPKARANELTVSDLLKVRDALRGASVTPAAISEAVRLMELVGGASRLTEAIAALEKIA